MRGKRLLCAAFAWLLACALPAGALAAAPSAAGRTELTGTVVAPLPLSTYDAAEVIQAAVPASGEILVNPYRMEVSQGGAVSTEQVVCAPMAITSTSPVPLTVTASAAGGFQAGSQARLVSAPPAWDSTEKDLFLYLEFLNGENPSWSGSYTGGANQLVVNSGEARVLTLPAAVDGAPVYGSFRAFGEAASAPAEAWSEADSLHVTVFFTFTAEQPESGGGAAGMASAGPENPAPQIG